MIGIEARNSTRASPTTKGVPFGFGAGDGISVRLALIALPRTKKYAHPVAPILIRATASPPFPQ